MTKKPASLTSQLLVRKGDATPAAVPEKDQTEPTATAETADGADSSVSAAPIEPTQNEKPETAQNPDPVFAATPNGMQPAQELTEEQDPVRPEPEIVMEPAPEKKPSSTKAYIGGIVAIIIGVFVALNFFGTDESGNSVAPLTKKEASNTVSTSSDEQAGVNESTPATTPTPYTDAVRNKVETKIEPNDPDIDDVVKSLVLRPSSTSVAQAEDPASATPRSSVAPVTHNDGAAQKAVTDVMVPKATAQEAAPKPVPAPVKTTKIETAKIASKVTAVTTPTADARIAQKGQYLIQLFSVRSQKDAARGWAKAQSKHKALLSSETLNIEKANLGERGIYYRVRFGAYDTSSAANSVCSALKKAKQDCLVKKLR